MHVDSNQLVWNTQRSSSSNMIVTDHPLEDKRIQVDDPPPCPICGLDDRVQVKYAAASEVGGHHHITIGCDRCLIYMHELHPLLVQGVLSITEHWGRRPSRDDFSKALSRARAADRYDRWLEQQARELGPFTVEEMESFFGKCIYELILVIRDCDSQLDTSSQAITSLRQVVMDLQAQIATRNKGLERGGAGEYLIQGSYTPPPNSNIYGGLAGGNNHTIGQLYGSRVFGMDQGLNNTYLDDSSFQTLNKGIEAFSNVAKRVSEAAGGAAQAFSDELNRAVLSLVSEDSKVGIKAELERISLLAEQQKAEELRKTKAAREALGQNGYPAGRKRRNKKR